MPLYIFLLHFNTNVLFPKEIQCYKTVLFLFITIIAAYCSMEDRVNIASLLNIYI